MELALSLGTGKQATQHQPRRFHRRKASLLVGGVSGEPLWKGTLSTAASLHDDQVHYNPPHCA